MSSRMLKAALVALSLTAIPASAAAADATRQAHVEQNSERVMPFRMDDSLHRFLPSPTGGLQTVMVRDGDRKQVLLVRAHLRKEATAFARGDFADPASIHGGTMPGLRAMRAGAKRIGVRYANVPNGAAITFETTDPALVTAIHAWFNAQVRDHGAHATMQM